MIWNSRGAVALIRVGWLVFLIATAVFTVNLASSAEAATIADSTVQADSVPPKVHIKGDMSKCLKLSPTLAAAASDNVSVMHVRFYLDGDLIKIDAKSPYSVEPNLPSYCRHHHRFTSIARDAAGNESLEIKMIVPCA